MESRLEVEYRPLESLVPYARNARTHSEKQVAQIAASIEEFGWTNPVLVDGQNGVVAGHGRMLAAKALGMGQVPVIELSALTAAQKRAYVLADNKLAENAGWDFDLVALEFGELQDLGFDVGVIGFDAGEVDAFMAPRGNEGLTDPDAAPEPPETPVSTHGDLWALGRHRVLCGDATSAADVERALGGVEPHLMVTDPPYGVEYDAAWRNEAAAQGLIGQKKATRAIGRVTNDEQADWREAWALFPGDVAYVWHAGNKANVVADSLLACGLNIRAQIIWVKNNIVIGRGDYHPKHEPLWYAVRKNHKGHYCGGRKQTTVWEIDKSMKSETGHSTQKPVECMRRPIVNNSSPGQADYVGKAITAAARRGLDLT